MNANRDCWKKKLVLVFLLVIEFFEGEDEKEDEKDKNQ
jgi:hypothetical protein